MREVAVLFARKDSIYKTLPGCDVWDMERDARKFPGGMPIVGHPPCRAWGQLRHLKRVKPRPDEKALAPWCVARIRENGGVLEHPRGSSLWPVLELPEPGAFPDAWGGWTLEVSQFHWGHLADKPTRFYIVGVAPENIPPVPHREGKASHIVSGAPSYARRGPTWKPRPECTKAQREHTPPALAEWLVELARRTTKPKSPKLTPADKEL